MRPYFFNTILGVLAFVVLILPFTGKVHDGKSKWFRGFTVRGWLVCAAFLLSILVNYLKDLQSEKEDLAKASATNVEKRKDDSIARRRNDESSAKIVNTFTEALARHGLMYDSAEKIIQRLVKDSAKRIIKNTFGNHPELAVNNIELLRSSRDTLLFKTSFYTKQAASYHSTFKVYVVQAEDGKQLYIIPDNTRGIFLKDVLIPLEKVLQMPRTITGNNIQNFRGVFYFVFIGSYSDSDNKNFPFKVIESYSMNEKSFGAVFEPVNSQIINLLHNNGIQY